MGWLVTKIDRPICLRMCFGMDGTLLDSVDLHAESWTPIRSFWASNSGGDRSLLDWQGWRSGRGSPFEEEKALTGLEASALSGTGSCTGSP